MLHQLVEQEVRDGSAAHGSAGVAALRLFNRVDGEQPQPVDGQAVWSLYRKRGFWEAGNHSIDTLFFQVIT